MKGKNLAIGFRSHDIEDHREEFEGQPRVEAHCFECGEATIVFTDGRTAYSTGSVEPETGEPIEMTHEEGKDIGPSWEELRHFMPVCTHCALDQVAPAMADSIQRVHAELGIEDTGPMEGS